MSPTFILYWLGYYVMSRRLHLCSHLFFMFASMLHWIDQIYDLPHVAALSSVLALGKRQSWVKAQLNSQNFHSVFFFFGVLHVTSIVMGNS